MAGDPKAVYNVRTNLGPGELNRITLEIFKAWLSFATGQRDLGGKKLKFPTGKYASSIHIRKDNPLSYCVYADDDVPEAGILEVGHSRFDLKTKFQKGKAYPMHTPDIGGRGTATATLGYNTFNSYASIGPNSTGWILPTMPAYSPAKILSQLARNAAKAGY